MKLCCYTAVYAQGSRFYAFSLVAFLFDTSRLIKKAGGMKRVSTTMLMTSWGCCGAYDKRAKDKQMKNGYRKYRAISADRNEIHSQMRFRFSD